MPEARPLFENLIDYAGLFPPAALSMEAAVNEYARHCGEPEAWMLSHFICPAKRLDEFAGVAAPLLDEDTPWTLSVLGSGGDSVGTFIEAAAVDRAAIDRVEKDLPVSARALEVRLPGALVADPEPGPAARELVQGVRRVFQGTDIERVFFEISAARDVLSRVFEALNDASSANDEPGVGVKIRTGGLEPTAIPSVEAVADFIGAARLAGLPFKATAGLHHPVRHKGADIGAPMHGFLNVFIGAALSLEAGADRETLLAVLAERSPEAFGSTGDTVSWNGHSLNAESVHRARRFAVSFGSCSFDEPTDDLRSMGWL